MSEFSCVFTLGGNPEETGHAVLIFSAFITYNPSKIQRGHSMSSDMYMVTKAGIYSS